MTTRRFWMLGAVALAACRLRADAAPPSARAPAFSLTDQDGTATSLDALTHGGATVLVFYRGHW